MNEALARRFLATQTGETRDLTPEENAAELREALASLGINLVDVTAQIRRPENGDETTGGAA